MVFHESLSIEEKLAILSDAAKYDVACTSSGMQREGKPGEVGNSIAAGICHSFSADGRCISLLKVLFTNECIFDCKYCINRSSNDVPRTSFTPRELCELTMGFYKRNYIEGLFLSSGILRTPDHTMNLLGQTLRMLREEYRFRGYIHCKAIPGADPSLVEYAGWYADRMSVNLELPTNEGLRRLAPNKTRKNILLPMRQIQDGIAQSREQLGLMGGNRSAYWYTAQAAERAGLEQRFPYKDKGLEAKMAGEKEGKAGRETFLPMPPTMDKETSLLMPTPTGREASLPMPPMTGREPSLLIPTPTDRETSLPMPPMTGKETSLLMPTPTDKEPFLPMPPATTGLSLRKEVGEAAGRGFAAAGQSTQMIIGATQETDFQIVSVAEALYQKFDLKRVFFSAFVNVNREESLPALSDGPPLLREHRLYQADWLLRYYGFRAGELLSEKNPNFNPVLDPKCDWAVRHLEYFPVDVMKADYFMLLRVPGIGVKSAKRIVEARKHGKLGFEALKRMGVVLKRAQYFITCGGSTLGLLSMNEALITQKLVQGERLPKNLKETFYGHQVSLFELPGFASAG